MSASWGRDLFALLFETGSLSESPGYPGTHRDLPVLAPQVPGLHVCTAMPGNLQYHLTLPSEDRYDDPTQSNRDTLGTQDVPNKCRYTVQR